MSTDGVLGAAYLPTDGYIDPSQLTFALAEGARRRGRRDRDEHARDRDRRRARPGRRGVETDKGDDRDRDRGQRRRDVRARDRRARRRRTCPSSRWRTSTSSRGPLDVPLDVPTMRDPIAARLLPRASPAGSSWAATSATRRRGRSTGSRPTSTAKLLPEDWDALRGADDERDRPRARRSRTPRSCGSINGPEAFTPDGEFILGESDVRGFWVAAGFCAHGLAGAGGMGQLVAEWIVEGTPSLDVWDMDSRRFGRALPQPRVHARPHGRGLRDVLRRQVPGPRAPGRPAAARLARVRRGCRARRRLRREVRLGARELVRVERRGAATSRSARAAGPGSSGRRRSAPSTAPAARRRRSSTRRRSRSSTCSGPGAADVPRAARAPTASPATSARSRTRRCSTRAAGSSATSP